jgi:hypothetical protein
MSDHAISSDKPQEKPNTRDSVEKYFSLYLSTSTSLRG